MVQKEVRKKTSVYSLVAVLSAVVLISMVYTFGSPGVLPASETSGQGDHSLLTDPQSTTPPITLQNGASNLGMKTFASIEELKSYLANHTQTGYYTMRDYYSITNGIAPQATGMQGAESADEHSTTNIQVAGVDEADTVKTDGHYIYTTSTTQMGGNGVMIDTMYRGWYGSSNSAVYILNADPQNAGVVSKIALGSDVNPEGLYLSVDSNRLVVLTSKNAFNTIQGANTFTSVNIYDVSNKASPTLTRNFTVSGNYFNSRMIGDYLYTVTNQYAYVNDNVVTLPIAYFEGRESDAAATSIYYSDMNDSYSYSFTSFYGLNIQNDQQQPTNLTVLMSGASTMYVSQDNIYVAYPTWANEGSLTSIYRVKINGLQLSFEAQGNVPGYTINQYALDEYNDNLRIVTNLNQYTVAQSSQINNLYILNQNLTIEGKLEGLGHGENLHSVRFMGDRGYIVTFKKTDPLFVIDLSLPQHPTVLGELVIPGYSDYLHPYDATHLIGVGKEAVAAEQGDFAWYQGVKLALFDVSNVNNPVQVANYVIGDRGTDSAVLNEPKAFLFDKTKDLIVIPVSLAIINQTLAQQYPTGFPAYGDMVWQGAYVFSVSANGNFTLRGTVTHLDTTLLNNEGYLIDSNNYYTTQNQWITRSLYIGNTLYTLSNGEVKLNNLTDLTPIATVNLS